MKSITFLIAVCFSLFFADLGCAQGPGKGKRSGERFQGQKQNSESQPGERAQGRRGRRGQGMQQRQGQRGGSRNMERFFGRLDRNQDGSIGLDEAPERMKGRFANIDSNSDNKITREELQAAFANMQGGRGGAGGKGMKGQRGEKGGKGNRNNGEGNKGAGKGAKGKSGKADKAEGNAKQGRAGGGKGRRGQMKGDPAKFFSFMDKDADGQISQNEATDRMKQNFNRLDSDQSGGISMEEFKTAIERMKAGGKGGAAGRNKADAGKNKKAQMPKRPPMESKGT